MDLQILISSLFNKKKNQHSLNVKRLPSQGYFYPDDLEIYIEKGNIDDQIVYYHGIDNSNIFGFISTIKSILSKKIEFNYTDFTFDRLRAIDVFFIFIEFVKYSTNKKIFFSGIEFCHENFVHFNFNQFEDQYNREDLSFTFNEWMFSLPSIGIETSLSKFSYEISIKGQSDEYKDKNYNLIYFLGDKTELSYEGMVNLVELFEDLDKEHQNQINSIVEKFSKAGLYFLIEMGKKSIRVNPTMLKEIWPISEGNIYVKSNNS
tara:strand:- start:4107 stop:4892 length:786 start_codon:yes stop_codon:yes gene_type:complete